MEFLYSQNYSGYKGKIIGSFRDNHGSLVNVTMGGYGCLIACHAMALSYFNKKAMYPDQYFDWAKKKGHMTSDGRISTQALTDASGGHLVLVAKPQGTTYGIRQVDFGPLGHYIFDDPLIPNMTIDPWNGQRKDFKEYIKTHPLTGKVFYFSVK